MSCGSCLPCGIVVTGHVCIGSSSYLHDIFLGKTPENGIPPSDRATRRYTKVHLDFCLRFSTLIGQIGRVLLFGAGPRRYIRWWLFRLVVTAFWGALSASWRQKGKRKQIFPRAIRTTELPSNPSPLTFRNNQKILQTSSTHATMATNVSQQVTITRGTWLSHAHTHIQRETKRDKSPDSPAMPSRTGGEINVVLQHQRMVRVLSLIHI